MASKKGELIPKLTKAKKAAEDNPEAEAFKGNGSGVISQLGTFISDAKSAESKIKSAKKDSDKKKAQKKLDSLANKIGAFGTKYNLKDLIGIGEEEGGLSIKKGTTFSIKPKKNWHSAIIEKV
jgi:hypothetical protein